MSRSRATCSSSSRTAPSSSASTSAARPDRTTRSSSSPATTSTSSSPRARRFAPRSPRRSRRPPERPTRDRRRPQPRPAQLTHQPRTPHGGTTREGSQDRCRRPRHHPRRAHRHSAHRPRRTVRLAEGHRGAGGRPARARSRKRIANPFPARDPEPASASRRLAARPSEVEGGAPRRHSPEDVSLSARKQAARERRLAEIAVLGVMVLWALNFIVVKSAVAVLPPVGFTFLRFTLASITLLVLLRWREGSMGLPRRDLVAICALGALGFGVYQILWTTGLTTIAAGDSALIIASTPVLVAFLAVLARSDVLTAGKLVGGIVSFGGVALVIASGQGLSLGRSLAGEAITLVAAICWAFYTAFGAPYLRRYSPLRTTAWATVAGTVVLAPIAASQLSSVD